MRLIKTIGLSLSVLAASAMAQDEAKSAWSGESELGYARSSGNTNSETLNFRQKVVYDAKPFVNTFLFNARNTTTEVTDANGDRVDQRTAEAYSASNKLDWFFAERTYAFFLLTADKDRFSGFDMQYSEAAGIGHQFIKEDNMSLKAELGAGASQKEYVVPVIVDGKSEDKLDEGFAYLGEEFTWKISEPMEVGQTLKVQAGEETTTVRFMAYFKAQLQQSLAFKMSYEVKYVDMDDERRPAGSEKRDGLLLASLLYSF